MQELQSIFWQRNSDVTFLKDDSKTSRKQDFLDRERSRMQRQNWVLKIMKTVKIFTLDHKKNMYEGAKRMMSYYMQTTMATGPIDLQKNFTEELINLFVGFYSQCNVQDMVAIKKVIRPNNAYIAVDLIKQLVETNRQFFKVKLQDTFKDAKTQQKQKGKILPPVLSRRELPTEQSESDDNPKEQTKGDVHQKIQYTLLQRRQNYANFQFPSEQLLKQNANNAYFELMERNSHNAFAISRFQQKCYGKSRAFNYNISGLYSQQQIRKMEEKLKQDVVQKFANIKQLKGAPSAEHLKEYFKIQVEIQDGHDKIESKKSNTDPVNEWVPLVFYRCSGQLSSLSFYVIFGKQLINIDEFSQKCGINLRNYVKMIIKQKVQKVNPEQFDLKTFKRHNFFDFNHAKKKQLMTDQHRVYSKQKNQSIFPMLRSNQLRQQTEIALKNRSLSENKLIPILRNESINKKILNSIEDEQKQDVELNRSALILKSQQQIKLRLEPKIASTTNLRLTISRQMEKREKAVNVKPKKIDNIIKMILQQRNLAVNI